MLDENNALDGAPETDRSARIKGEILGTLAALKSDYGTENLELAWIAIDALLCHIGRTEGAAARTMFCEDAGKLMSEEARDIHAILDEDFRKKLN